MPSRGLLPSWPPRHPASGQEKGEGQVSITKKVWFEITKIYFNDTLHLAFSRREVIGLQSWTFTGVFSIELTFRNGATITTEYDDVDKWKQILQLIEGELTL